MKTNKLLLTAGALFAALALSLTGCKKDSSTLKLSNNYVSILVGESYSVKLNSGDTDVTSQATWAVANDAVATINAGTITGVAAGNTTFTATYNGSTLTGDIEVVEVVPDIPQGVTAVANGITIVAYLDEDYTCYGGPQLVGYGGNWTDGLSFEKVSGSDGWWKIDLTGETAVTTAEGKLVATGSQGAGYVDWNIQLTNYVLYDESTATYDQTNRTGGNPDNFKITVNEGQTNGIVYLYTEPLASPCETSKLWEVTLTIPACTYSSITDAEVTAAGGRYVYITGSFTDESGTQISWGSLDNAIKLPVTENQTSVSFKANGVSGTTFQAVINATANMASTEEDPFYINQQQHNGTDGKASDGNLSFGNASEIVGWKSIEGCSVAQE